MRPKRANAMDPRRCENCTYFYQHYVRLEKSQSPNPYIKCGSGHCGMPRLKTVSCDSVCDLFAERNPRPAAAGKKAVD